MKMDFIPLMSPSISEQDIEAVAEVLRSGMLVQGENVAALERCVADYLQVKNAVAVSNGTATLHLALIVLGIGAGDEVIVPAFSYIATANVIEVVGAKPVFVDVERTTFNIAVSQMEQAITPRTRAILPVHQFGLACDISELMKLARKHDLFVIEDAACALGATAGERCVGTFGDVGSFSLHPRKAITSGEGGLLTTEDDGLAEQFRCLRNHGIKMRDGKMDFIAAGLNYRMTDFQAALVRPQFENLDEIIARREALTNVYFELLKNEERISLPSSAPDRRHTWQTFHILVDEYIDRDELIVKLKEHGIGTNLGAQCIPYQTYYLEKYGLDCEKDFPNALLAFKQGLALPLYPKLSRDDIQRISKTLLSLLD